MTRRRDKEAVGMAASAGLRSGEAPPSRGIGMDGVTEAGRGDGTSHLEAGVAA